MSPNMKQYGNVDKLGLTFQSNRKFMIHIKVKLSKANRMFNIMLFIASERIQSDPFFSYPAVVAVK